MNGHVRGRRSDRPCEDCGSQYATAGGAYCAACGAPLTADAAGEAAVARLARRAVVAAEEITANAIADAGRRTDER